MIAARSFANKRVALFGLGGSGVATARALVEGGADVTAFDDNPDSVAKAEAAGIPTGDLRKIDWSSVSSLVLAPGVPLTHPKPHWTVDLARAAGVEIIGDIEIFARERRATVPNAPFIAITGTNGKSTTTALIAHLLRHAGRDAQMGGNIGKAVMTLDPIALERHYVIECSSYQIELAPSLDPSIGILLNLTPDHLDRHGTMQRYASIKEKLVAGSDHAVIGIDDIHSEDIARRLENAGYDVARISKRTGLDTGLFAKDGELFIASGGVRRAFGSLDGIGTLRGQHNAQNALAAIAACLELGLGEEEIFEGLKSFPGLAHRMELVGHQGRVLFVNDSKATNAEAAAPALASFGDIYWIAGGLPKEGGIEALRGFFPRVTRAYLIGEAAPVFAATLGDAVPFEISGALDAAIQHAARDAGSDDAAEPVVLLSPACASFDQFKNFEIRGDAFRNAAQALDGFVSYEGISR
ncbi:UDP-N-acetylmuramoyl-L-alanine--D-glutamate ligase [Aliihoeflea sp. PC F10.4]